MDWRIKEWIFWPQLPTYLSKPYWYGLFLFMVNYDDEDDHQSKVVPSELEKVYGN